MTSVVFKSQRFERHAWLSSAVFQTDFPAPDQSVSPLHQYTATFSARSSLHLLPAWFPSTWSVFFVDFFPMGIMKRILLCWDLLQFLKRFGLSFIPGNKSWPTKFFFRFGKITERFSQIRHNPQPNKSYCFYKNINLNVWGLLGAAIIGLYRSTAAL